METSHNSAQSLKILLQVLRQVNAFPVLPINSVIAFHIKPKRFICKMYSAVQIKHQFDVSVGNIIDYLRLYRLYYRFLNIICYYH